MRSWHDFLDSLDTDGATRAIGLFLIVLGIIMSCWSVPKSEDILMGAFGFLLGFMKASGSNKDRREGPPMPLPTTAGASPVVPPPVAPEV